MNTKKRRNEDAAPKLAELAREWRDLAAKAKEIVDAGYDLKCR